MQVKRLVLHQFRNIEELSIEPHSGVNVIHGRNAQGKTNVLEALYLSATLKSFRGAKNAELIQIPHSEAAVRTIIERRELTRDILIRIKSGGKYVTMDEKKVRNLTDYFGQVAAVVFSPEDLILSRKRFQSKNISRPSRLSNESSICIDYAGFRSGFEESKFNYQGTS